MTRFLSDLSLSLLGGFALTFLPLVLLGAAIEGRF